MTREHVFENLSLPTGNSLTIKSKHRLDPIARSQLNGNLYFGAGWFRVVHQCARYPAL
jgi:hypothetical protein